MITSLALELIHIDKKFKWKKAINFLKEKIYKGKIKNYKFPFGNIKIIANNILTPEFLMRIHLNKAGRIKTKAGRISIVIDEYGNVWPSELISEKLGNLREFDHDIKKVLSSKDAKTIINKIRNNAIPHECNVNRKITL